ncbi:Cysteinyl-tRNA synthetase [Lotmaria passim]
MDGNTAAAKVVAGLDGAHPVKRDRHPVWYPPTQVDGKGLKVVNSLTETLEDFAPRDGRLVRWYTCGPTVYDLSHMGHARAYLTFDIIRRIMEDYFGYSVIYQMNITDIDDKIIKRARVNKLLDDFKAQELHGKDVAKLKAFTADAVAAAEASLAKRKAKLAEPIPENANSRLKTDREEKLMEAELKTTQLTETKEKIAAAKDNFEALFAAASGVNGDLLDEQKGHSICDQQIFEDHARKYERAFFDDMQRLGIREPDVVSRVTEYVPQVVEFVQKIMDNGFAYQGESSIFFDTEAYIKAGHDYPKLKPGGDRNTTEDEMAEGEGALSKGVEGEKRSPNDFALWKFSKPGEPRWPSPWGEGRPGWHIECSVMASDVLGENMDIHSGGWDLKFPHHDNECAQSEACNLHHQWVNYFLHCGHLHIKGLKMSKSLKNFITIRQALDDLGVTPRTMRLLFLANPWNKPMNFSDQSLDEAKEKERVLRAFFGSVDVVLRGDNWSASQGANARDRELLNAWVEVEAAVHAALQNNFDTVTALQQLMQLVAATNQYLLSGERPSATLLRKVGRYVTKMFRVFGVVDGSDDVGLQQQQSSGDGEARLISVVDTLVRFRDEVRDAAKAEKVVAAFLPLCDKVRDEWLIDAGVRLEDKPTGPTTWKNDDPLLLRKEQQERREQQEGDRKKKLANQIETKRKLVEKWAQFTYPPSEFFRRQDEQRGADRKYAAFDENTGMPTRTVTGEDVGEKEVKKLSKEVAKYTKSYEEFESKGGAAWLKEQEAELASMVANLQGSG